MATEDATHGRGPDDTGVEGASHPLPDRDTCETILAKMLLIRRFEERAGEMYAKAKIGGFLHLCIGEEATIVGATQAMAENDYLLSLTADDVPGDEVEMLRYLFTEVHGQNPSLADGVQRALGREPRDFTDYARDAAAGGAWQLPARAG